MTYQCSGGLAENKTSDKLDLFLELKGGNNQIGMWLDSHTKTFRYVISNRKSYDNLAVRVGSLR